MSNAPFLPTGASTNLRVLDSGSAAREVALLLGLAIQDRLPVPGDPPVVVVVADKSEVDALAEVEERSWIGCTVAWQLPEAALGRLYELGVAVFVGLPTIEQIVHATEYPLDPNEVSVARAVASRLATIESLLGDG
ncbi:MAG: hypothetical protein F2789_12630 [Actinobacteria bacterium]|nr:hypothetical protein [Actinomycetota bacterium]